MYYANAVTTTTVFIFKYFQNLLNVCGFYLIINTSKKLFLEYFLHFSIAISKSLMLSVILDVIS